MNHTNPDSLALRFHEPNVQELTHKEWVVANGMGGFASSSLCFMNTRRYHGLLVSAVNPPTGRRVLVSRVEESIQMNGQLFDLATNQYPGNIHPKGFQHLQEFQRSPFPKATYAFGEGQLNKTVFMPQGSPTTILIYHNPSDQSYHLTLRPQLVNRDHHSLFYRHESADFHYSERNHFHVFSYNDQIPPLYMKHFGGRFTYEPNWYYGVEYWQDQQRGATFQEDTFNPGQIHMEMEPGAYAYVVFSTEPEMMYKDPNDLWEQALETQEKIVPATIEDPFVKDLLIAADQFIVHRESTDSASVIAGYHWFTDWGRDTMIALRGLAIAQGKQELAASMIQTFMDYLSRGMLPNRFPDQGMEPEYNTVDATLWLFVALYEYDQKFQDEAFVAPLLEKLRSILLAYIQGTRYQIHINAEGFVFAGNRTTQLTWMDARVWGHAITPRWGCPVEINALWYNALCIYQHLCQQYGGVADEFATYQKLFEQNFEKHFLNEQGYLNDVIVPWKWADNSLRCNQIYVLSLPFSAVSASVANSLFHTVHKYLYTPYGLRTLSPNDPQFRSHYQGNDWERDNAYHQGTVWPFLLEPYFEAFLKLSGNTPLARKQVEESLEVLKKHFYQDNCIHGISEIFDGLEPHSELGKGTIHQAWSLSSLLYLIFNYNLMGVKDPKSLPEVNRQVSEIPNSLQ